MHILLLGANGFIGKYLTARLLRDGHRVTGVVRDAEAFLRRFPDAEAQREDLNDMIKPEHWEPLLPEVDAVVNCAGLLRPGFGNDVTAVQSRSPKALFYACQEAGIRKVVQISAVNLEVDTDFARSKADADDYLQTCAVDWTILRPSLVYAKDSYGGTSLMRALAACPFVTPVPSAGANDFQPIHVEDLADTVAQALEDPAFGRQILYPCGPEKLTLPDLLAAYRGWLGFEPAKTLTVPAPLIRLAAKIGDVFGTGPLNSVTVAHMFAGNACDPAPYLSAARTKPRSLSQALQREPAGAGDLWHARLYLLRPLFRVALIAFWFLFAVGQLVPFVTVETEWTMVFTHFEWFKLLLHWTFEPALAIVASICLLIPHRRKNLIFAVQSAAVVLPFAARLWLLHEDTGVAVGWSTLGEIGYVFLILVCVAAYRILEEER